ncbi:MAG: hypothetical protein ABIP97_08415 [Chthoniobacterales bacterium]
MPQPTSRLVQIPRDALVDLLAEAGREETPEEFLNQQHLRAVIEKGDNFQKRARAAYWSRFWLALSAAVSLVSLFATQSREDLICVIVLGAMTVVEVKVYQWFLEGDNRAPVWGWYNQCLFSFLFLIYGSYHFLAVSEPSEIIKDLGPAVGSLYVNMSRLFYAAIGIGGAIGQFILALYYRSSIPHGKKPA